MHGPAHRRSGCPLLWAALALASGIALAGFIWRGPLVWLIAIAVFLAAALLWAQRRSALGWGAALVAVAVCGGFVAVAHRPPPPVANLSEFDGREVTLVAHVTREASPHLRGSRPASASTFDADVESLRFEDSPQLPLHFGVRTTVYSRDLEEQEDDTPGAISSAQFGYGERLRLTGRLRLPRNFGNPGAF